MDRINILYLYILKQKDKKWHSHEFQSLRFSLLLNYRHLNMRAHARREDDPRINPMLNELLIIIALSMCASMYVQ